MKDFIHRIWYGDVCPEHNSTANRAEIDKLLLCRERHRERLLALLNDEQKKAFEKYESGETELYWLSQEDAFTEGVRYAVRFLVEAMG